MITRDFFPRISTLNSVTLFKISRLMNIIQSKGLEMRPESATNTGAIVTALYAKFYNSLRNSSHNQEYCSTHSILSSSSMHSLCHGGISLLTLMFLVRTVSFVVFYVQLAELAFTR